MLNNCTVSTLLFCDQPLRHDSPGLLSIIISSSIGKFGLLVEAATSTTPPREGKGEEEAFHHRRESQTPKPSDVSLSRAEIGQSYPVHDPSGTAASELSARHARDRQLHCIAQEDATRRTKANERAGSKPERPT